jgi:hypothetical protein
MTFSQGWDATFKAVMIYIGVVFAWLRFIEGLFSSQALSVLVMNATGLLLGITFLLLYRRSCHRERLEAEADIAALMREVE